MFTNAQVAALITDLKAEVATLKAAQGAPVKAQASAPVGPTKFADSEFGQQQLAKRALRVDCAIHAADACNRTFNPTNTSGIAVHNPKIR